MSIPTQKYRERSKCPQCSEITGVTHPDLNASCCPHCGNRWSDSTETERAFNTVAYNSYVRIPDLDLNLQVTEVLQTERIIHAVDTGKEMYRIQLVESKASVKRFDKRVSDWKVVEEKVSVISDLDPWTEFRREKVYACVSDLSK